MTDPLVKIGKITTIEDEESVVVKNLTFAFPTSDVIVDDFSLTLPRGSRAILCGANGAGKTTLLQILGGKYMVNKDTVRILGRPAFHDLQLVSSGDVSFLGPTWRRDIAFAGNNVALQVCYRFKGQNYINVPDK
jgi:CCR4-NOT complex subunit CAF16